MTTRSGQGESARSSPATACSACSNASEVDGNAAPFFLANEGSLLQQDHGENHQLDKNCYHATARLGKKNRCDHDGGADSGRNAFLFTGKARKGQHQWNGNEEFHESGVVVVIYVGAVNRAAHGGLTKPVQLAVGSHALQQRERGDGETIKGENHGDGAGLGTAQQGLPRQKTEHGVGTIQ